MSQNRCTVCVDNLGTVKLTDLLWWTSREGVLCDAWLLLSSFLESNTQTWWLKGVCCVRSMGRLWAWQTGLAASARCLSAELVATMAAMLTKERALLRGGAEAGPQEQTPNRYANDAVPHVLDCTPAFYTF